MKEVLGIQPRMPYCGINRESVRCVVQKLHLWVKFMFFLFIYLFSSVLEGQLRCLMDRVDELNQEAIKFNRFQQQVIRQQQDKHRFLQKRVRLCVLLHVFSSPLTMRQCCFFPW